MKKQEIENLKVGNKIVRKSDGFILEIKDIIYSEKYKMKYFISKNNCKYKENTLISEYNAIKTKKTPYTAETFPENALWTRMIRTNERLNFEIKIGAKCGLIKIKELNFRLDDEFLISEYEIGCQVIKDGEIKIEWRPFYIEE